VWGGSVLMISQSTIVESLPMVTLFAVLAYYFFVKKRYTLCAVAIGAGIATHGLVLFVAVPLFFSRPMRKWRHLGILVAFALFYLYVPLVNHFNPSPAMWGNASPVSQWKDVYSVMTMLSGGLAVYDLPKRILDTVGILGISLGLGLVPIVWYFAKQSKIWRNQLFWIFVLPIIYFVANFSPQCFVYILPSVAFGAIIVGVVLPRMRLAWGYAVLGVAVLSLGLSTNYLNIGWTLDKDLSATEYYEVELAKVPDGQILMPYFGWEWAAVFAYNKNESRNIVPVGRDTLLSPTYQGQLKEEGIKLSDDDSLDRVDRENYISQSIARLNDNVWTTVPTTPETYGCEVVPARDNMWVLGQTPAEQPGQMHWKPSNPWSFITGSLEVVEWRFLTLSNWNVAFFATLGCVGLILNWLIFILPARRKPNEKPDERISYRERRKQ
jgi:hypothetical protein